MQYILLLITIICFSSQQILQKQYNTKEKKPAPFLFLAVTIVIAMVFFLLTSKFKLNFTAKIVPHSIVFSIFYTMSYVGNILALSCGSLAITTLVLSYALVLPAFYGVIFLNEQISPAACIGFVMLIISIFLLNLKKEKAEFSLKWIVFLIIAFFGEGFCTIVQKNQQLCFDGAFKNEFMILALAISAIIMLIFAFANKELNRISKFCIKTGTLNGISNAVVNLFIMILSGIIPNFVLFPSISAGGIAISFVTALLIFREKFSKIQLIGYAIGVASVVLLNL